jgi:chemotaxis protein CheD
VTIVRVQRGEHHVSQAADEVLSAEVAAGVSLCCRDPKRNIGGMVCILLPAADLEPGENPQDNQALAVVVERYGAHLLEQLFVDLEKRGCRKTRLEAKVFGGGARVGEDPAAGPRTLAFVNRYLEDWGIPVAERVTGGGQVRRVQYFPVTGKARVMVLDETRAPAATALEQRRSPIMRLEPGGAVEIWD